MARMIKPNEETLAPIITEAVNKLLSGTSSITLNIKSLLELDNELPASKRPTIVISEVAEKKMKALVKESSEEIAWHGLVERLGPLNFRIYDILVYPQTVTRATVESDDDLYPLWLDELEDKEYNAIRMQGHSHVNMGVFASATDTNYYEELTRHISDYYIFFILNKSDNLYVELRDITNNILYETKDVNIYYEAKSYKDWAEESIDEYIFSNLNKAKASKAIINTVGDSETEMPDEYDEDIEDYYRSVYPNWYNRGRIR